MLTIVDIATIIHTNESIFIFRQVYKKKCPDSKLFRLKNCNVFSALIFTIC